MNTPLEFTTYLWTAFTLCAIGCFWRWGISGWQNFRGSPYSRIISGRNASMNMCLGILTASCIVAVPISQLSDITHIMLGFVSGLTICLHAALDPNHEGFWHHRRLKWLVAAFILGSFSFLGSVLPEPVMLPLISAGFIYHRHHVLRIKLISQSLSDIQALKRKLLSLEAQKSQQVILQHEEIYKYPHVS